MLEGIKEVLNRNWIILQRRYYIWRLRRDMTRQGYDLSGYSDKELIKAMDRYVENIFNKT